MSREDEMRPLFEQWRASGSPRATFAREHNIPINTFHYWCQRFEGKRPRVRNRSMKGAVAPAPSFVEIATAAPSPPVVPMAAPRPRMRFELPDGTTVTIY